MKPHSLSPNIHNGQFLWMDAEAKAEYLKNLKMRIDTGYYFSDSIMTKIVDELAPVMDEYAFEK